MIPSVAANAAATLQRRLAMLLNGPDNPRKSPLSLEGSAPHLMRGSLGSPESSSKTASRLLQPFFFCTAHHSVPLLYNWPPRFSSKIAFSNSPWGSGPHLAHGTGSTPVIMSNGISIGSAVFVWVPNAMLCQLEKKLQKIAPSLGISSPRRRRNEPRP